MITIEISSSFELQLQLGHRAKKYKTHKYCVFSPSQQKTLVSVGSPKLVGFFFLRFRFVKAELLFKNKFKEIKMKWR